MIIVVTGVSGSGKTTVGTALAERLGWPFLDADDFHPASNIAKMAAGVPLDDADRAPWLDRLNAELRERDARGESVVIACSALRYAYRERLAQGVGCVWVFLDGSKELIRGRIEARRHRYMPAALLESQFAILEPPAEAIVIDIERDVPACVDAILAQLPPERP